MICNFWFYPDYLEPVISQIEIFYFCIFLYFKSLVSYISTDFSSDFMKLVWTAELVDHLAWYAPREHFYQNFLTDAWLSNVLLQNTNLISMLSCYGVSIVIWLQHLACASYVAPVLAKTAGLSIYFPPLTYSIFLNSFKYFVIGVLLLHTTLITRAAIIPSKWVNLTALVNFFYFVETEEELGALEDFSFALVYFFVLFGWYFLVIFCLSVEFRGGYSFVVFNYVLLVLFVLSIPANILLNFGLTFASYIRGAGTTPNIYIEILFDLLGTLVVFTRFIVQNIRFILLAWAYIELFEYLYNSSGTALLNSLLALENNHLSQVTSLTTLYVYCLKTLLLWLQYFYYFLHLLILLFIQLGAYFLISFWLFFFFYTSFYLMPNEKYFIYKRYMCILCVIITLFLGITIGFSKCSQPSPR